MSLTFEQRIEMSKAINSTMCMTGSVFPCIDNKALFMTRKDGSGLSVELTDGTLTELHEAAMAYYEAQNVLRKVLLNIDGGLVRAIRRTFPILDETE